MPPPRYLENPQAYRQRRFCSPECVNKNKSIQMKKYHSFGKPTKGKTCPDCFHNMLRYHNEDGLCSLCSNSPKLNLPCAARYEYMAVREFKTVPAFRNLAVKSSNL